MVREVCDHCGELKECHHFHYQGRWKEEAFIMRFCEDCGMKILDTIREGVN